MLSRISKNHLGRDFEQTINPQDEKNTRCFVGYSNLAPILVGRLQRQGGSFKQPFQRSVKRIAGRYRER
jgi:hypothetical protein